MSPFSRENLPFLWRRLHSLTGVVPAGVFVALHLWSNFHALQGQRAYRNAAWGTGSAYFVAVEILGLYVPLAFHASYGLALLVRNRVADSSDSPRRRSAKAVDRVSSVALSLFIIYHVFEFRIPVALGNARPTDFFPTLCDRLSSTTSLGIPLVASIYLLGVAAASYHFAHGLSHLCSSWGIPLTERASRLTVGLSVAAGLGLFLLGASTVLYFATGSPMPGRV